MIEKPLQQLLTRREMSLFVRFGVGPVEIPTPKEKEEFDAVVAKIRRERRRARQAMRRFLARAEKHLNMYGESLYTSSPSSEQHTQTKGR